MAEWFSKKENAEKYLELAKGYDGKDLVTIMKEILKKGTTILEIGMGPGKDVELLASAGYKMIGSDASQYFVDLYRKNIKDKQKEYPNIVDIVFLDAIKMELKKKVKIDAVYSNKVLHHLSRDDMIGSFKKQIKMINPGGYLFHSMWKETEKNVEGKEYNYGGVPFFYYKKESMKKIYEDLGLINVKLVVYKEMGENDSLFCIGQKKAK